MITIITPSYNQGSFIRTTIESVLSQGIDDLEYIVMDGGSSDSTVSVLQEYDGRILWESKPDKGQADAVNQGLAKATGDIIGWLNSDDIYYPDTLKTVCDVFNKHPDVNVLYGHGNHIDVDGAYIEDYYTEDFDYERLKDVCFICQPAVFFRKKMVDAYGGLNADLRYCMDYEYWLRLGQKERFLRVDALFAGSRLYSDNKTLGARRKVHEEIVRMMKEKFGKSPTRWIYNLAHVICDERGIPREVDGKSNPAYLRKLAMESSWLFFKYQGYVPVSELRTLKTWFTAR